MFRVIIAGGRDFTDASLLFDKMDFFLQNVKEDIAIVCGMAKGTDQLGLQYAVQRGYKVHKYPADWDKYGKSAGYKRNCQMAKNADALVAFWDGQSKGTKHMIEYATQCGLKVRVVRYMISSRKPTGKP